VLDVDLGFTPDRAATIAVAFDDRGASGEESARRRTVAFQQIVERVSALPGVEAAGLTDYLPLGRNRSWGPPVPKGTTRRPDSFADPLVYVVSPGFLSAMGTHVRGRDFAWSDGFNSPKVVIISAAAASAYWPGEDAVGKVLSSNGDLQVIGVADDVRSEKVEESTSWQIYYPVMQQSPAGARLVVRSRLPIESMRASVLGALRALNPQQPTATLQPLRDMVAHAVSPRRFFMLLVSAMAGLGLILAALGIHGVIAYSVTRQTRDIGLRMALGATTRRVRLDVLWSTLRLAVIGVALGLVASLALSRLMASLLFDASPWDVTTYVGMTAVFVAVALLSGYLPARRASRIDPVVALKNG
jgi:predicted permease